MDTITHTDRTRIAVNAAKVGIAVNAILFLLKLSAAYISSSVAMLSDALHSAADVASAAAILVGIRLAGRKPSPSHPYGYGKFESISALLLSVLLFLTALGIGWGAIKNIIEKATVVNGGFYAISVSIISILIKEAVFRYTYKKSVLLSSEALFAEAWHHRADSVASVGSLIGVTGAKLGYPLTDSIAGIVISFIIAKTAVSIFCDSCLILSDVSASDELTASVKNSVDELGSSVHSMRSRRVGAFVFFELTLSVDGSLTCKELEKIKERVRSEISSHHKEIYLSEISFVPNSTKEEKQ